jgi:hypothetical protein
MTCVTAGDKDIASRLGADKRDAYVAFIDLLGFSERVRRDWADAAAVYGAIMAEAARSQSVVASEATLASAAASAPPPSFDVPEPASSGLVKEHMTMSGVACPS